MISTVSDSELRQFAIEFTRQLPNQWNNLIPQIIELLMVYPESKYFEDSDTVNVAGQRNNPAGFHPMVVIRYDAGIYHCTQYLDNGNYFSTSVRRRKTEDLKYWIEHSIALRNAELD